MLPSNLRSIASTLVLVAILIHTPNSFYLHFSYFLYTDITFSISLPDGHLIVPSYLAIHILLPSPPPIRCNFVLYFFYEVMGFFSFWLKFSIILGVQFALIFCYFLRTFWFPQHPPRPFTSVPYWGAEGHENVYTLCKRKTSETSVHADTCLGSTPA